MLFHDCIVYGYGRTGGEVGRDKGIFFLILGKRYGRIVKDGGHLRRIGTQGGEDSLGRPHEDA